MTPVRHHTQLRQVWRWVAHHAPWILGAVLACRLVTSDLTLDTVAYAVGLVAFFTCLGHTPGGCRRCAVAAAAANLSGPRAAVARYGSQLWAAHHCWSLLIAMVVTVTVLRGTVEWATPLALVVDYGVSIALAGALLRHRALQPWCPLCGNDDDNGGEHEPAPDPLPVLRAHR